jgi:hypothetical protein
MGYRLGEGVGHAHANLGPGVVGRVGAEGKRVHEGSDLRVVSILVASPRRAVPDQRD